jgi:hypothetical protein
MRETRIVKKDELDIEQREGSSQGELLDVEIEFLEDKEGGWAKIFQLLERANDSSEHLSKTVNIVALKPLLYYPQYITPR